MDKRLIGDILIPSKRGIAQGIDPSIEAEVIGKANTATHEYGGTYYNGQGSLGPYLIIKPIKLKSGLTVTFLEYENAINNYEVKFRSKLSELLYG